MAQAPFPADGPWEQITPEVNSKAEFVEIVNDFGDPLELLREAISNSFDANATEMDIRFEVRHIDGAPRLVITIRDNGEGMAKEVLGKDFWGLGYSKSRGVAGKIGMKGHGTKIYLRSELVCVRTQGKEGSFESECDRPLRALAQRELHQPRIRAIEPFLEGTGTEITIVGYNDNQRGKFVQNIVRDYILWFTKIGSVERCFGIHNHEHFRLRLKCLDWDCAEPETISFGHVFPEQSESIEKLWDEKGIDAGDWYVKRKVFRDRLPHHPEVTYEMVVSIEGDAVKRQYNPMIRERNRQDTGRYRVGDRYGLWVCRDYIPVDQVNDWITGFGSGSNAYVLLHAFVNCQRLELTANRGTVANTDPAILEELRGCVKRIIDEIDSELIKENLYTLKSWQEEETTKQREKDEFVRRTKNLKGREICRLDNVILVAPRNEAELFGLFMSVYAIRPALFLFEPLDYNTNRGIDIVARNKSDNRITDGEHWYIELKHTLQSPKFNHTFEYIRWIVCWDFDKTLQAGAEIVGIDPQDVRTLSVVREGDGPTTYFLDSKKRATKIQIIRLNEFLRENLGLEFRVQA
jgi:hypothetical protein